MLKLTHFYLVVLLSAITVCSFAQDVLRDTIYVSNPSRNVKIKFDKSDEPPVVDIGTKEFGAKILGCCDVILKAAVVGGKPTSLYIGYGDKYYNGTIAYKENLPLDQEVLDFRTPKLAVQTTIIDTVKETSVPVIPVNPDLNRRIGILEGKSKDRFSNIAVMKDKMVFKVADVMQDDKYLYVKLGLYNESKTDYTIDMVDFLFRNTDDERDYKQVQESDKVTNLVSVVPAKGHRSLVYAFPKFTITTKWELLVSIREKNGGRKMELDVPFDKINEASKF